MYFPRNCEFGSAMSKLRNLGGGGVHHWQELLLDKYRAPCTSENSEDLQAEPITLIEVPNTNLSLRLLLFTTDVNLPFQYSALLNRRAINRQTNGEICTS
jgi:hypothetical protein